MAIIGWIACIVVTLWISAFWGIAAWDGFGKYNIGGVPNSALKKLILTFSISIPMLAWWAVVHFAPFTVSLN